MPTENYRTSSTSDTDEATTTKESDKALTGRSPLFVILLNSTIIGLVAVTWCLSTQFSKSALNFDKVHFNAPYFMMWFNLNFMITCFPVFLIYEKIRTKSDIVTIFENYQAAFGKRGMTPITFIQYVTPFLVFWVGANYPYVRALLLIAPSVATSISACNAAFVYILAVILLKESIVVMKIVSVIFAIGGVVVISLDQEMKIEWLGILLAFLSAFMAAVYKVSFKRIIGNASLGDVSLFMTSLGVMNICVNWIVPLTLALTGVETVQFYYAPWGPMIGAALLSIVFNFTINFGIALLNPLVISVGMLCGIPLNTVIDIVFRDVPATTYFLLGTGLIICSFVLIIFPYDMINWTCSKKKDEKSTTSTSVNRVVDAEL